LTVGEFRQVDEELSAPVSKAGALKKFYRIIGNDELGLHIRASS
jgi:hypothetical protein